VGSVERLEEEIRLRSYPSPILASSPLNKSPPAQPALRNVRVMVKRLSVRDGSTGKVTRLSAVTEDGLVLRQHELELEASVGDKSGERGAVVETTEENIVLRDPSHWQDGYRQFLRKVKFENN
jgi:hypothetical protein